MVIELIMLHRKIKLFDLRVHLHRIADNYLDILF